jgi:hypothetical protein
LGGLTYLKGMQRPVKITGPEKDRPMSTARKNKFFATLDTFVTVFGSAAAVSAAVEGGRAPKAKHLNALGIDPVQFESIRR